jgi:nucleoside-diphosphate-sugar epimerase
MSPMRLVVTGANGFVGRHVVAHAAGSGWDVSGVVRSNGAARVVGGSGGHPVTLPDLERDALSRAFEGSRAVVHLAQIGAERGGQSYEAVNVDLTGRVVEACRRAGVRRIVYFSGLGVARYGMSRRCTNGYFRSKLAAEALLVRSDREGVVFRPSYIVGPGDAFVPTVLAAMAEGEVERPGDGSYRMQPIAVADATALVLAAVNRPSGAFPTVFDLVGPEPVSFAHLLDRLARVAREDGRPARHRVREVAIAEAERRARDGGYQGMLPDELDCLLCDEIADHHPLEALLGRRLTPLDTALAAAVRAA